MEFKDEHKKMKDLSEENYTLKQQLLWYKRTYEDRRLAGIVYDRVLLKMKSFSLQSFVQRRLFKGTKKIRIAKQSEQRVKKILCAVVNHNYNSNAIALFKQLNLFFDTILLDSGSNNPPAEAYKLPNVYYPGLLNEAFSLAESKSYDYLLFVCSDVFISPENTSKLNKRLRELDFDGTGIYSPSSKGGGHFFCKKMEGGQLRKVPFVEGFIFLCDMSILKEICPINTLNNKYGWGLDIAMGYFANEKGQVCVIDDNIEVTHAEGTGYSRELAEAEMYSWVKSLGNEELYLFFEHQINKIRQAGSKNSGWELYIKGV